MFMLSNDSPIRLVDSLLKLQNNWLSLKCITWYVKAWHKNSETETEINRILQN